MTDLSTILRKCIAGKRKYQDLLYDRFSGLVYGICLRYARDQTGAEDLFQESFIKVYQNLRQVENADALPGWIRSLTVRTCIDKVRKDQLSWNTSEDTADMDNQQYEQLLDKISEEEIIKLINELPDGYRLVFNLNVVDGFSHKEIAEQLNIAESTSRSQLTYAKRLLQLKLKKMGITRYESVI
jgi:RNA polymerase sigma factor (sigma-70 family)